MASQTRPASAKAPPSKAPPGVQRPASAQQKPGGPAPKGKAAPGPTGNQLAVPGKATPSGAGASAARALTGQAASAKGQAGKKQAGKGGSQQADSLVSTALFTPQVYSREMTVSVRGVRHSVDVVGGHALSDQELSLFTMLREAGTCQRVTLQQVAFGSAGARFFAFFPEGARPRARLPTLLRFGTKADTEAEVVELELARDIFHEFVPEVIDKAFAGEEGVLQLSLRGARCCLPKFLANYAGVRELPRIMEEISLGGETVDDLMAGTVRLLHQVFRVVLPRSLRGKPEHMLINLFETFSGYEAFIIDKSAPNFGPDYFDGGTAGLLQEERGSLLSDGGNIQDLVKVVSDACGKPLRPSAYFADFHSKMNGMAAFWHMNGLKIAAAYELTLGNVILDGESKVWVVGRDGKGRGRGETQDLEHSLMLPAAWLTSGLFLHTHFAGPEDEAMLRRLVLLLASVPERLDLALPLPPADASACVRFAYQFVQQMLRHCHERSVGLAAREKVVVERADLQLLWAMLDRTIPLVTHAATRANPERKRLALFASVAFASRLWAATGKANEPKWYNDMKGRWRPPEGKQVNEATVAARLYVQELGTHEAWSACAITGDTHTLLEDNVSLEVAGMAGDGVDNKVAGLPGLYAMLQEKQRLLVVGGPGSGRTVLLQGLLGYAAQELLSADSTDVLPLRVPVHELAAAARSGASDPIQEHISRHYNQASCEALAWEIVDPPPFPARYGHQVVVFNNNLYVYAGLAEGNRLLQDAWVSRDRGRTWEELPPPPWPARYGHQVVICEGNIVLLAGLGDGDRRLRDVWSSSDGWNWTELPCPRWAGRGGHQAVVADLTFGIASPKEHIIVLGGHTTGNVPLNDAWASNNGGQSWHELELPGFSARFGHRATVFQDKLIILGGVGEFGQKQQDAWVMTGQLWKIKGEKEVKPKKGQPAPELPKWPPAVWEHHKPLPWAPRENAQVVQFRDQLVLFGGVGQDGKVLTDAWASYDGKQWKELPSATWRVAAARYGHEAVVTDGRQVVLGGADSQHNWSHDVLISRRLLLTLDNLDEAATEDTAVTAYLDRLLRAEPHHQVLITTGPAGLDHLRSMHLDSWAFTELRVQPFKEADLRELCARRLGDLDVGRARRIEEEILNPQYADLVGNPLVATMMLGAFTDADDKIPDRCHIYDMIFGLCLQDLCSAKQRDTSEFKRLQAAGVDLAATELALEAQSHGLRAVGTKELDRLSVAEARELLARLAHAGGLVLFEVSPQGLQFRHQSMQEYLAAHQLWRRLNGGDPLPPWILREGSGSEAATGCGRFFCSLASRSSELPKQRFVDLCEGFGNILRNMARVGDQQAVQTLLRVVPNRQPLLATVDTIGQQQAALHLAAANGHHHVARTLLEMAPDPVVLNTATDINGYLPLHCAASNGHEACVRVLLEMARDRSALVTAVDRSERFYTALHLAAKNGHHKVARTLLELAPSAGSLNAAVDLSGFTPLHHASQNGHEATVRVLISRAYDRGILLTTLNKHDQRTALHLAAERGEEAVVRALLELAPDKPRLLVSTDKLGQTALHLASEKGHHATIRALLEYATDRAGLLHTRERLTGQTALHLAADNGHGPAVRALLQLAPDPAALVLAVDKCGRYTALHLAAEKGRAVAVRAILELTADRGGLLAMEERFAGQLALHLASSTGCEEVVRALLELAPNRGALLAATDQAGCFTPVHLAAEQGHEQVLQALLELAPDRTLLLKATLPRWSGFTPLHLAAYRGHEAAARIILQLAPDRRALLAAEDNRGRTPGDVAWERGRKEVAAMLTEAP